MKYHYDTCGTCSRAIDIEINDGVITSVAFAGGCHGNTQGVAALVAGMKPEHVVGRIKGIKCGSKGTSCPDQLAKALEEIMEKNA
ncbi:MAG: TIGR03905 family TSCPD domain-containing protein [Muribaculaceae bacterium]|nr:TIGR03905 family TSCPD domain-containing protein [Muribaculaceae bacterium]